MIIEPRIVVLVFLNAQRPTCRSRSFDVVSAQHVWPFGGLMEFILRTARRVVNDLCECEKRSSEALDWRPLTCLHPLLANPTFSSMSQAHPTPTASTSSSNFQYIFNTALDRYENKTKKKLLTHPLFAQLQSYDSPAAILSILQGLVQQFEQGRSSDERLSSWLNPTVNVLFAFSGALGEGVGLVNLCGKFL